MIRLCEVDAVPSGEIKGFALPDGKKVAVYNVDGEFYVTDDLCTHGEASLSEEGLLDGHVVECAWHFGSFDVITGQPKGMPCTIALRTYPAVVREKTILISLEAQ